ncbi:MAG: dTDP-4-dehydrorhamnose reductase [Actinomycetota bacterium]|jgi:dTDP-4-dehydrorhamnose reductase|nr:dTDP-4-dehydrorhamnose reductase [Rubrobacter sp.]MDQ3508024.1 dTDP-4-dehydrorhamnose reductase [Actinomycetota bacterium]
MKALVTGANGQLGLELARLLPERGHEIVPLTRRELDVSDFAATEAALDAHSPDLVINAAAYTDVDGCETEGELSYSVNALGPANLARGCESRGVEIVHVSTNYVFDGEGGRPYEPFDPALPISAYGRGKLAGEELVMRLSTRWRVVRSAGVYGEGDNFVRTMLRVEAEMDKLKVKNDEYISPTYAKDLAEGVIEAVEEWTYGLYHVTNSGSCSWHEFAEEIFRIAGVAVEVEGIPGSEYPLPAARPANGVLSGLGSPKLRHWREALAEYMGREDREGEKT